MKKYLMVLLLSMVPLFELRGAIPISQYWGLSLLPSYICAIIGNMIPVPFIYLFARKALTRGKRFRGPFGKFCAWVLTRGERAGEKLQSKAGRGLFFALFLFVGVPLPGTGAWSGTLASSILKMDFKSSILACMCGVILAGIIMGTLSAGVFTFLL